MNKISFLTVRFLLIQSDPNGIKFDLQQSSLLDRLCRIQHYDNEIRRLSGGYNLTSSSSTLACTFDDPGKIETVLGSAIEAKMFDSYSCIRAPGNRYVY